MILHWTFKFIFLFMFDWKVGGWWKVQSMSCVKHYEGLERNGNLRGDRWGRSFRSFILKLHQNEPPYHSTCSPVETGQSLAFHQVLSNIVKLRTALMQRHLERSTRISITGHMHSNHLHVSNGILADYDIRIRLKHRQNPSSTLFLSPCCNLLTCDSFPFLSSIGLKDTTGIKGPDYN